jgi:uncharacterized protein
VLDGLGPIAVAVSGGVDSMTLAFIAHRFARVPVSMVHAVSPAVPAQATARVQNYAAREGWDLKVVGAGEFDDPRYRANPVNRCYFCKTNLYDRIRGLSGDVIASGANLDDLGDYRPGLIAAAEREVVHPYIEAKIGKAAVRLLARHHKLDDLAELPAQPCLSSRVETGIAIDAGDLAFIEEVESGLARVLPAGATLRCRIVHDGVAIELGEGAEAFAALARDAGSQACARAGRVFRGVRTYRRGSAFIGVKEATFG